MKTTHTLKSAIDHPFFLLAFIAVLYFKNTGTFDLPYVVLGACIHGALAALLACPYAIRVLDRPGWSDSDSLWELCMAVVLVFFVVACTVRLLAEHWWTGFF